MGKCTLCDTEIPKNHRYCKEHRDVHLACYQCGKPFALKRYEYDRRPTKNYHCSRPCYLAYMTTEEYKEERREQSSGYWESEEYREKIIEARAGTYNTPEEKKRRSKESRRRWRDPEYRKKHNKSMKKVMADPEHLAKVSRASKKMWQDPEYRALQEKIATERWQDEEYRERVLKALPRGPDNHNWNGGSSFLPYGPDFTKELKAKVRERDGHKCQLCSSTENLCVHHIDYDKFNNEMDNLVTLCNSCHPRTLSNRGFWQTLFENYLGRVPSPFYTPKIVVDKKINSCYTRGMKGAIEGLGHRVYRRGAFLC